MSTKTSVSSLNDIAYTDNLVYLINTTGDLLGNEEIPQKTVLWFQTKHEDVTWWQTLVKLNGRFGILATFAVAHPDCDSWETLRAYYPMSWDQMSAEDVAEVLMGVCDSISQEIPYDVFFAKGIGIDDSHEINIFVPFGENMTEVVSHYKTALNLINW